MLVIHEKYKALRAFENAQRKDIARFMSVDQSDLSDDCKLLQFEPRQPLNLKQVFVLWLFRQSQKNLNLDRRVAAKILASKNSTDLLLIRLNRNKINCNLFCQQFEQWLLKGISQRLSKKQPKALFQANLQKKDTITRRTAAQILGVSPSAISAYQKINPDFFEIYQGADLNKVAWMRLYVEVTNFKIYKNLRELQAKRPSLAEFTALSDVAAPEYLYFAKLGDSLGYTNEFGEKLFDWALRGEIRQLKIDCIRKVD